MTCRAPRAILRASHKHEESAMPKAKVHPAILALIEARAELSDSDVYAIGSAVLATIGARDVAVARRADPAKPAWNAAEFLDALRYFATGQERKGN